MEEAARAAALRLASSAAPWSTGGSYLNFGDNPTDTRTAFSADAYRRLQDVRHRYDPEGLFLANHPILSGGSGGGSPTA